MNLKQFVKIHPFRFALFVLGSIVVPAIAIFSTYLTQTLTNVILARNWHEFILIAIVCFIIMLILYFLLPIVQNLDNYLQQDLNQQVRAKIVKHYYDDQKQHTVADMQNRLTNDLTLINENYFTNLFGVIYGTVLIISVVIYLILLSWQLLIVICIMVAVSLLLPKLTEKPLQKANQMISDSNQAYLDTLNDWLSGLEQIRQFMAGAKLFSVTANASKKLEDANVKQTGYIKLLEAVNEIVSALFGLILFILAGVLVKQGSITIGALMIVGNFRFYLSQGINMVTSGRGAMKGTTKLIDEVDQSASKVEVPKEKQGVVPASIETHDLKLQFPNGEKLVFADLQIKQGEKILLTGDSGAGKSTLFKLILGELKPSEGNVVYKDQNGKEIVPDLSKIGYIPQNPVVFPATIEDNITMFNEKLDNRVDQAVKEVDFDTDIAKFKDGLNEELDLDKLNISGGQRQKIVLARAKVHNSDIILIDEGTSAIDQNATMDILKNLVKSKATIVFIAHNFNEGMRRLFDREIHLVKG
ncbi:ATP-binding cassette domain-containing protein [Lactobacillus amylovorus]|uniref:ATP-binding cassette domain-containing protein n=1 Tax=Lactobacillus amylovorus TaxID=1604 RepID=UPI00232EBF38|nr:ABC transporter ATP-binding protein [Lactobacillus amylovorus]MDB6237793.1 ABC transporter ATP-binding protein/permease [Lactobacillus amylovorus]